MTPQQLEQEIERTREQLGETVEQLAARADVKSRVQAKAAEVSGRVKATAGQAQQEAAARAGRVRSQLADKTAAARQKAVSAGGAGKGQLQSRLAAVGTPVWEATPEPLRRAAAKGASAVHGFHASPAAAAGPSNAVSRSPGLDCGAGVVGPAHPLLHDHAELLGQPS